jgi:MoaA/NifB/PqqE/SkfB family radical SAM enzyme
MSPQYIDMRNDASSLMARLRERYRMVARMNPRWKGIRAYTNWVRSNYELWAGASRIKARPVKLTFDPTNVCQLRCPLCPTGLRIQDRPQGRAQLEMLQRLLDEVGDYVFFIDFFNWGEPLLNPEVESFIRLASSRKIVSSLSTNLCLPLTDERIRRIIESGLGELIVSLDGASNATYTTYRRQGRFELVYENLRRIVDTRQRLGQTSPLITWQFLVFRFNEHEMERAKALAAEIGVDRIVFQPPFLHTDRYPLAADEKTMIDSWASSNPRFHAAAESGGGVERNPRCGWHYMATALNWDGSVAPCCTTYETRDDFGTLGAAGEHSYMDVVNNSKFRFIRDRFAGRRQDPLGLVCESCPTPSIMGYHRFLNRQVVLFSTVGLLEGLRALIGRRNILHAGGAAAPAQNPPA